MLRLSSLLLPVPLLISIAIPANSARAENAVELSAELGPISDYRFRGVSLSGRKPALQAELSVEHKSGLYAQVWASSISDTPGGADVEIDWLVGQAFNLAPRLSLDAAATFYSYPGDSRSNYAEGFVTVSYDAGAITPQLGLAYAPKQDHLRDDDGARRDNVYAYTGLDAAITGTPVTLHAKLGYERGLLDFVDSGGKWDWQVGVTFSQPRFELGLAYVDSDATVFARRKNLADGTIVASAMLSW